MTREHGSRGRGYAGVVATFLLAGLLAGCTGAGGWRALDSLEELQARFNEDAGRYRLILLLSPT